MENDPKLDRVEREIAACENGAYGESPAWLYLLGLSDWKDEKELLMEERNGEDYTENM